jgi:two-component system chemotaxis response regulator CheB
METSTESSTDLRSPFDAVAIAASYGGIDAIKTIVSKLPAQFPAPIVFLQHVGDYFPDSLPHSIGRHSKLLVKWAERDEQMAAGHLYLAPPGSHLAIDANRRFVLANTPRVLFVRPSANVLFSSLAVVCKRRLLAVVLTGYGSDGAIGISLVKSMGGQIIIQDQRSSAVFDMPRAALRASGANLVLPLEKIAPALIALTMTPGAATLFAGGSHRHSFDPAAYPLFDTSYLSYRRMF